MPGGSICSVASCKSNSLKAKKNGIQMRFFLFPSSSKVRKIWRIKCRRKDKFNANTSRICSLHFKNDDYEDEMQARLMNYLPRKLKRDAVPSLYLPFSNLKAAEPSQRAKRYQQKIRQETINIYLAKNNEESGAKPVESSDRPVKSSDRPVENSDRPVENSDRPVENSDRPVENSDRPVENSDRPVENSDRPVENSDRPAESSDKPAQIESQALDTENSQQPELNRLRARIQILEEENQSLKQWKNMYEQLKSQVDEETVNVEEKSKLLLKDVFSSNELDLLLKKKTKVHWTSDEISKAFTILYFSKRCYLYLRNKLHLPLPGISTLKNWATNINK